MINNMEKDNQKDIALKVLRERFNNIGSALYLVTNHLSDIEPLKTSIRSQVHNVLNELFDVTELSMSFLDKNLSHIKSLMTIASNSNLISKQNANLLNIEIESIQAYLKEMKTFHTNISFNIGEILSINANFELPRPDISDFKPIDQRKVMPGVNIGKGHYPQSKMLENGFKSKSAVLPKNTGFGQKLPVQGLNKGTYMDGSPRSMGGSINTGGTHKNIDNDGFSARQSLIIKEIKSVGQLTIRDLVGKIEGCSEKTIQRELLGLVETGVLKKEGERRWSRYSVV